MSESKNLDAVLQKHVNDMEWEIVDRASTNGPIIDARNLSSGPWKLLEQLQCSGNLFQESICCSWTPLPIPTKGFVQFPVGGRPD